LFDTHLLSLILFTPLIGALVLALMPRDSAFNLKMAAHAFGALSVILSISLLLRFPTGSNSYSFEESAEWIPYLGAKYSLGVDGISLFLVLLTTFLGMLALLASWNSIQARIREYYILILLVQSGALGVFLSKDLFLFYLFWEVMLVPVYFLIAVWGGERRVHAAVKFFLYTLAGSVLMLLGIMALYYNATKITGVQTFDIPSLLASAQQFPDSVKSWIFWAFFCAFAIKVPLFPFHTWMPDAHTEAPTPVSVLLAGVLLKTGTYGFIRFSLPLLPRDPAMAAKIVHILTVLSILGILYGAVICLMQKDMKRLLSYSSLSSMGFCVLGIFSLTPQGLSGSVMQQINHGISTGALFFLFGFLYERRQTGLISEFGGLATPMPRFASVYLICTLSALGLPLLNGFISEFAILQGTFIASKAAATWAVLGVVLGAAYLLSLYQRTMLGAVTHDANKSLRDLSLREYFIVIPLVVLIFWLGIYPKPFLAQIEKPVERIIQQVNPTFYQPAAEPGYQAHPSPPISSPRGVK
jgi:NADH-quinone oxidoreductase subunit M